MGTIIIKVPQEIHIEYEIDNLEIAENLLETIKHIEQQPKTVENNILMGLFADEAELIDQVNESAM